MDSAKLFRTRNGQSTAGDRLQTITSNQPVLLVSKTGNETTNLCQGAQIHLWVREGQLLWGLPTPESMPELARTFSTALTHSAASTHQWEIQLMARRGLKLAKCQMF
ncbi:MAG: hypothetical protein AAGB19_20260 [Cyanobacteria bacterium P01_F01_bin.3]